MLRSDCDAMARFLAAKASRRRFGGAFLPLELALCFALPGLGTEASAARKRRKRRQKRRKNRGKPGPCVPNCLEKTCGPDGCGGSCGACGFLSVCVHGECRLICKPDCAGKECGSDGCFGSCGMCMPPFICKAGGVCGF
jgi:hypothetical protein